MTEEETGLDQEIEALNELFYFIAANTAHRTKPPQALVEKLNKVCRLKFGEDYKWKDYIHLKPR